MILLRRLQEKIISNWPSILFGIFLFALGCILYMRLGRDYLFDWDEGIYGELGRELLQTKNIIVSFWNDSPWLEKPPGITWITALGIAIVGPSALGARLLMPLFALYTLYIVYRIGSHLGNWKQGLVAAGVLATFNLFLGRTRAVNTDMPLLAGITTTVLFLLENRPSWWVALAVSISVLFKGPAALLTIIIALPLFFNKSKKYLSLFILHCSLFIIPWHLYSYLKYGSDFITPYLSEQVFRRATAQIEFHFENRWYYFAYLYENLGLGVLLVSTLGAIISLHQFLTKSKKRLLNFTLLWWVLVPLAIFTLAKTRLFWYILPIYPALALLVAQALGFWQTSKLSRSILTILAIGIGAQALLMSSRSVEIVKSSVPIPDRLYVAQELGKLDTTPLIVLVPPSERLAEALLPEVARLSSSFRYGGMPSVVYYYAGPVKFYYDVDKFRASWLEAPSPTALISEEDSALVPGPYHPVVVSPTYLGIQKGVYALR